MLAIPLVVGAEFLVLAPSDTGACRAGSSPAKRRGLPSPGWMVRFWGGLIVSRGLPGTPVPMYGGAPPPPPPLEGFHLGDRPYPPPDHGR